MAAHDTIPSWVLAVDRGWLAVEKPAGMSAHNDPGSDLLSLVSAALDRSARLRRLTEPEAGFGPHLVHRLDRDTSGVALLACRPECLRALALEFSAGRVSKRYLALLAGRLPPAAAGGWGSWRWPLAAGSAGRHNPRGSGARQACHTRFRVLAGDDRWTLAACAPLTGRTHQIRRHACLAGHPLAGDSRYGPRGAAKQRLGLHALALTLRTPGERDPRTLCSRHVPPELLQPMRDATAIDAEALVTLALEEDEMTIDRPTREQALELLKRYNTSDSLIRHALAVEAVMRHFARQRGQDEEQWGVIGLVHDLDFEQFPEQHCTKSREILEAEHWPDAYVRAVVSHGWGICSDVEPHSELEKVLFAVDELTGLVATSALVRPSRSVLDLSAASVRKKWKDKRFAAGVDRSIIERGAAMLGMELETLIHETIMGMRQAAEAIGLKGHIG
jgi:predicted hydrolase (HD superfamily)/23S rRNA-/tRNA-specific pseudouridylate synthase